MYAKLDNGTVLNVAQVVKKFLLATDAEEADRHYRRGGDIMYFNEDGFESVNHSDVVLMNNVDPDLAATVTEEDCNSFTFNSTLFQDYIRTVIHNVTTFTSAQRREIEGDPLVYIVAVLLFYSCGIVVLMIHYMKKEQHDSEEAKLYKQYMEKARNRCDEFNNRGSSVNKLALQALNAVNVVSQEEGQTKVAFV